MDTIIITVYGLFLLTGAYFGMKAGSRVSLIMGLISSALVFLGLFVTTMNTQGGFTLLAVVGGVLSIVFGMRLMKTKKIMPSGMLLGISLAFLGFCVLRLCTV